MRAVIGMLVIIYLVGVGVMLAPTIRQNWTAVPASELAQDISRDLPRALSWPVVAYHSIVAEPEPVRS